MKKIKVQQLLRLESPKEWSERHDGREWKEDDASQDPLLLIPNDACLEWIDSIDPEIRKALLVLAFSGKARQGKSTIASILARFMDPELADQLADDLFEIQATHTPVTDGIWLLPKCIPFQDPTDGSTRYLLIIDTEGVDRGDDRVTARITAVACFLSSLLVLHVRGDFNNNDLKALSSMQTLLSGADANGGAPSSSSSSASTTTIRDMFPDLMVVSRSIRKKRLKNMLEPLGGDVDTLDFTSPRVHECLDAVLATHLKNKPDQDQLNTMRAVLRDWYPSQSYGISTDAKTADLPFLAQGQLAPEDNQTLFWKTYRAILTRMVSIAKPKRCAGMALSSTMINRIIDHVQSTSLSVKTLLFYMHWDLAEKLVDQLVDEFSSSLQAAQPSSLNALNTAAQQGKTDALSTFTAAMERMAIVPAVVADARILLDQHLTSSVCRVEAIIQDGIARQLHAQAEDLSRQARESEIEEQYLKEQIELVEQQIQQAEAEQERAQARLREAQEAAAAHRAAIERAEAAIRRARRFRWYNPFTW